MSFLDRQPPANFSPDELENIGLEPVLLDAEGAVFSEAEALVKNNSLLNEVEKKEIILAIKRTRIEEFIETFKDRINIANEDKKEAAVEMAVMEIKRIFDTIIKKASIVRKSNLRRVEEEVLEKLNKTKI